MLKYHVLLHDAKGDVPLERANKIYADMKTEFGQNNCNMLVLNSYNPEESPRHVADVWSRLVQLEQLGDTDGDISGENAVDDPEHFTFDERKIYGQMLSNDDVTR